MLWSPVVAVDSLAQPENVVAASAAIKAAAPIFQARVEAIFNYFPSVSNWIFIPAVCF
jgi:hypothetical protein